MGDRAGRCTERLRLHDFEDGLAVLLMEFDHHGLFLADAHAVDHQRHGILGEERAYGREQGQG